MERSWHPEALKFPLLEGEEKDALKDSLQSTKGNRDNPIEFRMVRGQRQYLDGRNRAICCDELGIKTTEKMVNVPDKELEDYFIRKNVARRHLETKFRQEWIARLRKEGKSTRQIAAETGVSKSTAARYSSATGVPNGTVTGKDGKQYQAEKPKPVEKQIQESGGDAPPILTDQAGNKIPEVRHQSFMALEKFAEMDNLCLRLQRLIDEVVREPGGEKLAQFVQATGSADKTTHKSKNLDDLKRTLRGTRPYAICNRCNGQGKPLCRGCNGIGWMTKVTWDDCEKDAK